MSRLNSVPDQQTDAFLILGDNYGTVRRAFYNDVCVRVLEAVPGMIRGVAYTAEQLLGQERWESMDNGDRRLAGRCLSHMVQHGLVPLVCVTAKYQTPKKYELI